MQATDFIWHNGSMVPWAEAKVHVLTHTLHYGAGAFEGIRFYKTERGPAIFRLDEHLDRLFYSAKVLDMVLPYSKAEIKAAILELIRINHLDEGYIRPLAYYGYGKMGANPAGNPTELVIACWPWGAYLPHECVNIKTSKYIRIHPDSTVADAKLCGHYLNGILALLDIKGTHYDEVLFLDSKGLIMEGSGENFFLVKNGRLFTPKLGGILAGVTRDTVIRLAKILGLAVEEADLRVEDVYQADEAFFTGTAAEVTAIRSLNDQVLGSGEVGEITALIKRHYMDIVHGRDPQFNQYLTWV